jgi:hypothetical protein
MPVHLHHDHGISREGNRARMRAALAINLVLLVAGVAGAVLFDSVALLADAGHVLSDVGAIAIGLVAAFNADTFEQGLVWAVNLGGDADANGAVTGALLGARLGASQIPGRWLEPLERRAEIEGLTERLMALAR